MRAKLLRFAAALTLAGSVSVASHAQVSDDSVKIGLIIDFTGIYADLAGAGSVVAANMAVEDFGGKVLGKPIEVLAANSQNKPDIASTKAREWFDTAGVDAILDVVPSQAALPIMVIAAEKNKIVTVVGSASTAITNQSCASTTIHWMYDTYSSSVGVGKALVDQGHDSWFFIAADTSFGKVLQDEVSNVVKGSNGKVLGSVKHPLGTMDFSSFLLQAQHSKAKVVALANAGLDAVNALKQAREFGLPDRQMIAPLLLMITEVHGLGLEVAQGAFLAEGFYWDQNDKTRAFSHRFFERQKRMPTMAQAGVYSAVTHYLKSVQAAGTDSTTPVLKKMRETLVSDAVIPNGKIREDGRLVHDMLLVQVKKPGESKGPWDYYNVKGIIPADQAFMPLSQSACPLVKK